MRFGFEDTLPSCCGVSNIGDFNISNGHKFPSLQYRHEAGCGWIVAGFTNTKTCKEAYTEMCALYTKVYQSPVRENDNSGNQFFFCVFDVRNPL